MSSHRIRAFICGLMFLPTLAFGAFVATAQTEVEKLQDQIADRNDRLEQIEKEISEYESALQVVGAEKNTLNKAIAQLELERKKVTADVSYTKNRISSTDLEINKLTFEINIAERDIKKNENAISEIIRSLHVRDNDSLIEVMLRYKNVSEFWDEIETLETIKNSMGTQIDKLIEQRSELKNTRVDETTKRTELYTLEKKYSGQQAILEDNKAEKNKLLRDTQNEESNYQDLLATKQTAREQLALEVLDIESQLRFILDPNTIPTPGTNVFNWPLQSVYITQYFGYTKFALANRGVYKNNMHNGMDMGAPTGTSIEAPLTGTVRMTGNTDAVPGCYSWGKWILIDHPNGLSTLYAHLSNIAVSPGQTVSTGENIGYVGSTGYSTGPHLHFTLYVSEGVEVKQFNQFKAVTGCGSALSPFAAVEAYLDPLDYLPSL